ncbi:MAG: hypothetical protein HFJ47_03335 [Clostridia bacterium]|nr:hypothetical protein [Clostridia bacterium]
MIPKNEIILGKSINKKNCKHIYTKIIVQTCNRKTSVTKKIIKCNKFDEKGFPNTNRIKAKNQEYSAIYYMDNKY